MSLNEESIATFDRYFKMELSDEEMVAFNKKLKSDPDYKERLDLYKITIDTVQTYCIGEETRSIINKGDRNKKLARIISAAAAAILLIIIPVFYVNYFQSISNRELFLAYYKPYPADQNLRGEKTVNKAMDLYRLGKYSEAITAFDNLLISDPENDQINFFLGNCYLSTNNAVKAIVHFKLVSGANSRIISQNSEWYLALAYLQLGDTKTTIKQLKYIASHHHLFEEKAKRLLDELQ